MKGRLSGAIAEGVIVGQLQAALSHVTERANYGLNLIDPIVIPSPPDLFKCINMGMGDQELTERALKAHGINPEIDLWQSTARAGLAYPTIDECLNGYWRGEINEPTFRHWVTANSVNELLLYDYVTHKPAIWSPDECRILHSLGALDRDKYVKWLRAGGMPLPEDVEKFEQLYQSLTWQETMNAWNRGYIDEDKAEEWFHLEGLTDPTVVATAKKLRYQIPSPSELIEFSVKEVWNRAIVEQFGYDDEFDQIPEYRYWMSAAGYGGPTDIPGGGPGAPENWAQAWWRAHWRVVSNTQAYEMLHRLRPTGGPDGGPRVPRVPGTDKAITPVSITDVENVLKVNDYPPYWRDKLAALSYRVLRLVDITRIIRLSLESDDFKREAIGDNFSTRQWAAENYMDRGQTPEDANTLATLAIRSAESANRKKAASANAKANTRYFQAALREYAVGVITREQAITAGNLSGFRGSYINTTLDAIDRENNLVCVRAKLSLVRKEFIKGHYSQTQALNAMRNIGIVDEAAVRYIACWRPAQTTAVIHAQTQEAQEALSAGMVTREEAMARLQNLGWEDPDLLLDVATIERDMLGASRNGQG